jgi:hypothetical protein
MIYLIAAGLTPKQYIEQHKQKIHRTTHYRRKTIHRTTQFTPKWSLTFRFRHQNPAYASPITHMRYMPSPSHSSRFLSSEQFWVRTTDPSASHYVAPSTSLLHLPS